jgi:hypothetical protein
MSRSVLGRIIQIGEVLISEEVVSEYFACDYPVCGGLCCIEGDAGAPLEEDEPKGLEADYPKFSPLMSEAACKRVDEVGFFELDREGELVTPCVGGAGECVFCRIAQSSAVASSELPSLPAAPSASAQHSAESPEKTSLSSVVLDSGMAEPPSLPEQSALCAIEMSGCTKPISCALYPIRISKMPGGGLALNLHRWNICAPAYEKGRREGIRVYQFLKAPLIRRFGPDFYEALCIAADHILSL